MKKKRVIMCLFLLIIILIVGLIAFQNKHTYTLSGDSAVKNEQIQPVTGTVKVTGSSDTNVIFTDVESGKKYTIGYITPCMGDTIQLERGKWYRVEGVGTLTMKPVNIRIE